VAFYKRYLDERISSTLRHNVVIRSQAQTAREAERQRIAADFHDGPMQSFISFQMRLEIVRKLLARDVEAAAEEVRQLQDLCRTQVADLRSFVRSMRPADEGMSLTASLSRLAELFQRDTGITATFSSADIPDPGETEVSLEVLQIVRETLNNIQKHSGATRVAISAARQGARLEIVVEDNGSGFPFAGDFTLEELELLRLGPVSVKRRVRMLGGELAIQSRPGEGAKLEIRVPV
jgi:two-component system sensor histidine kinase DegS